MNSYCFAIYFQQHIKFLDLSTLAHFAWDTRICGLSHVLKNAHTSNVSKSARWVRICEKKKIFFSCVCLAFVIALTFCRFTLENFWHKRDRKRRTNIKKQNFPFSCACACDYIASVKKALRICHHILTHFSSKSWVKYKRTQKYFITYEVISIVLRVPPHPNLGETFYSSTVFFKSSLVCHIRIQSSS